MSDTPEDLLNLWRAAAEHEAFSGKSERAIVAFLQMKGIPTDLAKAAAPEIHAKGLARHNKDQHKHRLLAWIMLLLGLFMVIIGFIKVRAVIGGGVIFIMIGLWWLKGNAKR